VVPEAPLERTDAGLVPAGEGWFVLNAREARWFENDDCGASTVSSARYVETPFREDWLPD
jgi:hypothetical protein